MNQNQELKHLNGRKDSFTGIYTGTYTGISGSRHRKKDEHVLAELGKIQVLKVRSRYGPVI